MARRVKQVSGQDPCVDNSRFCECSSTYISKAQCNIHTAVFSATDNSDGKVVFGSLLSISPFVPRCPVDEVRVAADLSRLLELVSLFGESLPLDPVLLEEALLFDSGAGLAPLLR